MSFYCVLYHRILPSHILGGGKSTTNPFLLHDFPLLFAARCLGWSKINHLFRRNCLDG
jgi:hypothetical protein